MTGRTSERLFLVCIAFAVGLASISVRAEERPAPIAAAADKSRPNIAALPVAAALAIGVLRDLHGDRGPGPDDRHVAADDVDEVRDLVERRAP